MSEDKQLEKLTGKNLKNQLWGTLHGIRSGEVTASDADAVASQAREILRTCRTELCILNQARKNVSDSLIEFAAGGE